MEYESSTKRATMNKSYGLSVRCMEQRKNGVSFNANGGQSNNAMEYRLNAGGSISWLPVVERDGYILEGWYTALDGGEKVTINYVPASNMTLNRYQRCLVSK